jgi:hypothetical protein
MNNSGSSGKEMKSDTLEQVLKFLDYLDPGVVVVSGGEFTEHPHFFSFVTRILDQGTKSKFKVILNSNGMFALDPPKNQLVLRLLSHQAIGYLQVTTDKLFYPRYDEVVKLKSAFEKIQKMLLVDGIDKKRLIPLGRVLTNHGDLAMNSINSPSCLNLYLLARQGILTLNGMVQALKTSQFNLCKPLIDVDGSIRLGETIHCLKVGDVFHFPLRLEKILFSLPCNKCDLLRNVSPQYMSLLSSVRFTRG